MFLDSIRYFGIGLLLIALQYFLLEQIHFGTWIQPMPYVFLMLVLPFSMNRYIKLFMAFVLGFMLDSISNTYGMHAAALTTLCFARIYTDRWLLDIDAIQLQGFNFLTPDYKGNAFYVQYTLALILLHHFVFFTLDYFKWSAIFPILFASVLSSIVTFLFILLFRLMGLVK